jgi:hypothetical protein
MRIATTSCGSVAAVAIVARTIVVVICARIAVAISQPIAAIAGAAMGETIM